MDHSIKVVIDGITIVEADDTDDEGVAGALESLAEIAGEIRKWGTKSMLRALCKHLGIERALFREASAGNALLSTVLMGQSKHEAEISHE